MAPSDEGAVFLQSKKTMGTTRYMETERYGFFVLLGAVFVLPLLGFDLIGLFLNVIYPVLAGIVSVFM